MPIEGGPEGVVGLLAGADSVGLSQDEKKSSPTAAGVAERDGVLLPEPDAGGGVDRSTPSRWMPSG